MGNTTKKLYGNAVVGQSGGPTAAINATLSGVIRGALASEEIGTLYGMRNGVEGLLKERLIDLSAYFDSEYKLTTLENTPAAALGSCRVKLPKAEEDNSIYENLLAIFKKYNIRYFFYIGGNDSMDTVAKLSEYTKNNDYEMRIMGVPKTIDNDLVETDHTPGFGSAAKYIATTVSEIIRDCAVYTRDAVTIVEIMGRDAGWLTAASAVGRLIGVPSPDLVYLPEVAFDMQEFFSSVREALKVHPNVVVAVSEGARFADGRYVGEGKQSGATDVFGHKYLSGTGKVLEIAIKDEIGCKVRSVELNLPQRCASHIASATDLRESVCVGKEAVFAAVRGVSRAMMTIKRISNAPYTFAVSHTDISTIANKVRPVPRAFINEQGNHVTDECLRYILPLIEGETTPEFSHGLPVHIIL